jgi:aminoglycoside N3'-acetyltransferase
VPDDIIHRTPITRSQLAAQLRALGLRLGSVVEVHCSLSSLGFVVGGADAVVLALLEAVGRGGTLLVLTGWDHDPFDLERWPERVRRAYLEDPPIFDPHLSEAARDFGRLAERIRTWPKPCEATIPKQASPRWVRALGGSPTISPGITRMDPDRRLPSSWRQTATC